MVTQHSLHETELLFDRDYVVLKGVLPIEVRVVEGPVPRGKRNSVSRRLLLSRRLFEKYEKSFIKSSDRLH